MKYDTPLSKCTVPAHLKQNCKSAQYQMQYVVLCYQTGPAGG